MHHIFHSTRYDVLPSLDQPKNTTERKNDVYDKSLFLGIAEERKNKKS
jgi:hypothetical protein